MKLERIFCKKWVSKTYFLFVIICKSIEKSFVIKSKLSLLHAGTQFLFNKIVIEISD